VTTQRVGDAVAAKVLELAGNKLPVATIALRMAIA
jgi:hypothetical protein